MKRIWARLLALLLIALLLLPLTEADEALPIEPTDLILESGDAVDEAPEEIGLFSNPEAVPPPVADSLISPEEADAAALLPNDADSIPIDAAHFPDEVFRAYVLENLDTDGNEALSGAERAAVTELNIKSGYIVDMKGIEYFTNLQILDYRKGKLKNLDVRQNTALTSLILPFNEITSLDVSQNPALTVLNLNRSTNDFTPGLSTLDVSHNPALQELGLNYNSLTSLDISHCPELVELYVNGNFLTALDASHCPELDTLYCYDGTLKSLNVKGCSYLRYLDVHENQLTALNLDGCASLRYLYCFDNQLTALDVSVSDCLNTLSCGSNPLKSLTLTGSLKNLYCVNTLLTTLRIYGCPTLIMLSERTPTRDYSSEDGVYYLKYQTSSYNMFTDEGVTFDTSAPPATPTPKPTAKPTVKPTAAPTATPKPTATPTVKPTTTPKPTAKPTVKPTATPEPENFFHMKKSASKKVRLGDTLQIVVDGKSPAKSYATSDKKVATVTKKGLVKAVGAGTAKITVTLKNKKKWVLTLKVTDPNAPKKITIDQGKAATLKKGKKLTLTVTLSPKNATKSLTWTTSDKKIATVSSKGVVTAKKKGKAKVTVTTANGKKATITITVK